MGRGSYIGGHTVIGPGSDWFSRDRPAAKKEAKKHRPRPRSLKLAYLQDVVRCELLGREIPKPYKRVAPLIEQEIRKKGSILGWARAYPEYDEMRRKALKRLGNRQEQRETQTSQQALENTDPALDLYRERIENLMHERAGCEQAVANAEESISRNTARISELEKEIRQLSDLLDPEKRKERQAKLERRMAKKPSVVVETKFGGASRRRIQQSAKPCPD